MPPRNTKERVLRLFAENTIVTEEGCHRWTGRVDARGYVWIRYGEHGRHQTGAHRVAYLLAHGSISADLDVDHLCHTRSKTCRGGRTCPHRACLNPAHMELVTRAENTKRAGWRTETCKKGHRFDEANTYTIPANGRRVCRKCVAANQRAYRARKQVAA